MNGPKEWADEWPEMKFGFTSDSFFAEVVENLSTSKILLETDAPYFLPDKVRQFFDSLNLSLYEALFFSVKVVSVLKHLLISFFLAFQGRILSS